VETSYHYKTTGRNRKAKRVGKLNKKIMNWYLKVLKEHYADFNGRARRKEYWMFALFNFIIALVLSFIDGLLGLTITGAGVGVLYMVYALIVLIPGIALSVRRLHDIGKSGWMLLVVFIPLIGAIWLLVLFVTDSNPGSNEYGPNPKESPATA